MVYISQQFKIIESIINKIDKEKSGIKSETFNKNFKIYSDNEFVNFKSDIISKYAKNPEAIKNIPIWLEQIELHNFGKFEKSINSISDVDTFWKWCSYIFNFSEVKVSKNKIMAHGLIFPINKKDKNIKLQHGIIYIFKSDKLIYTYVDVNNVFKENKENTPFNLFYVIFHFIYWICFLILYKYHFKKLT